MSVFTDFMHKVVDMLPFHDENLSNDAHAAVEEAEKDILEKVQSYVDEKLAALEPAKTVEAPVTPVEPVAETPTEETPES